MSTKARTKQSKTLKALDALKAWRTTGKHEKRVVMASVTQIVREASDTAKRMPSGALKARARAFRAALKLLREMGR